MSMRLSACCFSWGMTDCWLSARPMRQPWKNNCPGLAVCDLGFEPKLELLCPFREVESVVT